MDTKLLGLILQGDKRIAREITDFKNTLSDAGLTESGAIVQTVVGKSIVANDTSDDGLKSLRVFGKTEQVTTTGKNLFNETETPTTERVFVTKNASSFIITTTSVVTTEIVGRIVFSSMVFDANKSYTVSFDTDSTAEIFVGWYGCNKTLKASGKKHYSVTLSEITTNSFSLGTTIPSTTITFSNIQIEEGTVETAYEPYTGGIPSPNPQYPQRLKSIGKSKNLLENKATSQTINGVTFTVNDDKSITVNGTATGASAVLVFPSSDIHVVAGETYKVTGCPSTPHVIQLWMKRKDGSEIFVYDNGEGETFLFSDDITSYNMAIVIPNGKTANNLAFYPMIRYADIEDATYEPYGKDDIEVGVHGGNLLLAKPYEYKGLSSIIEDDGTITVSGTPETNWWNGGADYAEMSIIQKGRYIFSVDSPKSFRVGIKFYNLNDTKTPINYRIEPGKIEIAFDIPKPMRVAYFFLENITANTAFNETIKLMLRLASIADDTYEPYKEPQSLTALTPNGLPGIKVTDASLATYTDSNGQMWCADEVDFERGVYVKRIGTTDLGEMSWKYNGTVFYTADTCMPVENGNGVEIDTCVLCSIYAPDKSPNVDWQRVNNYHVIRRRGVHMLGYYSVSIRDDRYTNVDEFVASVTGIMMYYILATPIETPLTAEELAAYQALHSNYPVTTILNDSGAHMELTYNADTKNYIDNKFTELTNAILSMGGNV